MHSAEPERSNRQLHQRFLASVLLPRGTLWTLESARIAFVHISSWRFGSKAVGMLEGELQNSTEFTMQALVMSNENVGNSHLIPLSQMY